MVWVYVFSLFGHFASRLVERIGCMRFVGVVYLSVCFLLCLITFRVCFVYH